MKSRPVSNKKILIAGHYGFGNTGDEAILSSIIKNFCAGQKKLEFIVASSNPQLTTITHQVQSIHWQDINSLFESAKQSDLIMIGGGGVFVDYWGVPNNTQLTQYHWGIAYYNAIGLLSILFNKPFVIHSVGVGPLITEEGKYLTKQTFEIADRATVRDKISADLLKSIKVSTERIRITTDPALFLEPEYTTALKIFQSTGIKLEDKPILGICIRNWESGNWKHELAEALDLFLETHTAQVVFIPFQIEESPLENDLSVSQEIRLLLHHKNDVFILSNIYQPEITKALLSNCHLVIGMRLHSLIFAVGTETSVIALAYDPKVSGFMESLKLSDFTVDIKNVDAEAFLKIINMAWKKPNVKLKNTLLQIKLLKNHLLEESKIIFKMLNKRYDNKQANKNEAIHEFTIKQLITLDKKEKRFQLSLMQKIKRFLNKKPLYLSERVRRIRAIFNTST